MAAADAVDVHQHLWPEQLVDRLRARTRAPYLRGWTLHTHGEPPYEVDPAHHDVRAADRGGPRGRGRAWPASRSPRRSASRSWCGPEAGALLDAWHEGARALPGHFRAWASVPIGRPRPRRARRRCCDDGFVGVQVPATDLLSPAAWERAAHVLAGRRARPASRCFVHPGPGAGARRWPAGCRRGGRRSSATPRSCRPPGGAGTPSAAARLFPRLRVLFARRRRPGARCTTSGTSPAAAAVRRSTRDVYVDTSSYGPQALDALVRVLGHRRARARQRPAVRRAARPSCSATRPRTRSAVTNPRPAARGRSARAPSRESGVTDMAARPADRRCRCPRTAPWTTHPSRAASRSTTCRAATSTPTSCATLVASIAYRPGRVGAPRRLRRRRAGLRLAAPRRPRRRLAAVLDPGERHRLARPRHLLRARWPWSPASWSRTTCTVGRRWRRDPGRRGQGVLLRARPHPPAQRRRARLGVACTPTARRCGGWASTPSATPACCAGCRSPTPTSCARSTDPTPDSP